MKNFEIEYFIDYWKDLTHSDNSIESDLVHSILYNPKELFKEFIEEIERKNLSNSDNKKFFMDKTKEFSKLDLNALKFVKPTLILIQQQFNKKNDYNYLLHLLKIIVLKLEDFSLGKEAVLELSELLTTKNEKYREKIKHLTNIIIFELINKKYSTKTIKYIFNEIFSEYESLKDESIFTEKIQAISNYFDKKLEKLKFIFQIKGLNIANINIKIGNVQIYNPNSIKLINNPTEHFDELFLQESKGNIHYYNGAVELAVVDSNNAVQEALKVLHGAFDIISLRFIRYKTPLSINSPKYYIIDKNGNGKSIGFYYSSKDSTYEDTLGIDTNGYKKFSFLNSLDKNNFEIDKKIMESMHWKRRATESIDSNEKILWYWVSLENIFTKQSKHTVKTIFEIIPKILARIYIIDFAWKHYDKIKALIKDDMYVDGHEIKLKSKQELADTFGVSFKNNSPIFLKDFIDNLESIKNHLNDEELLYQQLDFIGSVFNDSKQSLKLIEKFEKIFYEKLVYIYRLRNKIVHNAYSETTPTASYYIDFIENVSAICIDTFIQKRDKLSLETSNEIINSIIYDYDEFKLKLKNNKNGIVLSETKEANKS